jgi:hypothetical protein
VGIPRMRSPAGELGEVLRAGPVISGIALAGGGSTVWPVLGSGCSAETSCSAGAAGSEGSDGCTESTGAPQAPQIRAPGVISLPQLVHLIRVPFFISGYRWCIGLDCPHSIHQSYGCEKALSE